MSVTIGKKIQAYRKLKGYKIGEIARIFSVSNKTVLSWESGKETPNEQTLLKFCEIFSVSYEDIVGAKKNTKADKNKIGLLDGSKGEVKSFDGNSPYGKLSVALLIGNLMLLILGMILQTFAKSSVTYFIGSILMFLTSITDAMLYVCFYFSKKRTNDVILLSIIILLFIASEVVYFIINFISLFYVDFIKCYAVISKFFPLYYIISIIRFYAFPFIFEDKSSKVIKSKRLTVVYLEIIAVSLVGFYFFFQFGYIIATLGIIALMGGKEDVKFRYYYFEVGAGKFVTYRDKEREKAELISENLYEQPKQLNLKTQLKNALTNLGKSVTLKNVALIIAVSYIGLFDFIGLAKYYAPLMFISLITIALIPIITYAFEYDFTKNSLINVIITSIGCLIFVYSAIVLPLPTANETLLGILNIIGSACLVIGYIIYLWTDKDLSVSNSVKKTFTAIILVVTICVSFVTCSYIFYGAKLITPWIGYLALYGLAVTLTTKYFRSKN